MRVSGSQHIFTKSGVAERINLQREGFFLVPKLQLGPAPACEAALREA